MKIPLLSHISSHVLTKIDLKIFSIGVGASLLFYGVLFGYAVLNSSNTLKSIEKGLASQTIEILRNGDPTDAQIPVQREGGMIAREDAAQPDSQTEEVEMASASPVGNKATPSDQYKPFIDTRDDLLRNEEGFSLPTIAEESGITPFEAYRQFPKNIVPATAIKYAIVFKDFGLSETAAQNIISEMPPEITLALSPYSDDPGAIRNYLGEQGYETWMQLPMETKDFSAADPGAQAILSRSTYEYNKQRLYWNLSRASGYAGITAYTDQAFDQARPVLGAVARVIFDRGLGFIEMNTTDPNSQIQQIALRNDGLYTQSAIHFENHTDRPLQEFLDLAVAIANNKGNVIFFFPSTQLGVIAARDIHESLSQENGALVPASFIVDTPSKNGKKTGNTNAASSKNNE